MCGITGYFDLENPIDVEKIARANDLITYRGPDHSGVVTIDEAFQIKPWQDGNREASNTDTRLVGALGFRRLSIIDLSYDAHQPMADATGNYWIVFNGEIYNYIELRVELEQRGHHFRSKSDTEVILNAYKEWGIDCLHKFNGMWAFCIVDRAQKRLFCARDRFGIKPFNFYVDEKRFAFGSEIKQVLAMMPAGFKSVNPTALFDYLAFGAKNHTDMTFFQKVHELRGGFFALVDFSRQVALRFEKKRWWNLADQARRHEPGSFDQAKEEFLRLLKDSIRLRLRSDVPVGTALSGGLDSSGITCLIEDLLNENRGDARQKVFTVISDCPKHNEYDHARLIIDQNRVEHYQIGFEHAAVEQLSKICWHHDQPVSSPGILGGWILQKLIADSGVVVNLNGQGADELMGGYSPYPHASLLLDLLWTGRPVQLVQQLRKAQKIAPVSLPIMLRKGLRSTVKHLWPHQGYRIVMQQRKQWLNTDFVAEHSGSSPMLTKNFYVIPDHVRSWQKRESYLLATETFLPHLLHHVDRDSMAFSLEARTPFLDYRLAEFTYAMPFDYLIHDGYTKYVYRKAMNGVIPDEILWNTVKKGFVTPVEAYTYQAKDYIMDVLSSLGPNSYLPKKTRLMQTIGAMLDRKIPYDQFIWPLITTAIWMNVFELN